MNIRTLISEVKLEVEHNYGDYVKQYESYSFDDLLDIIDTMQEKYDDLKKEYEDYMENSKPIPVSELNGISDRDFI